MARAIRTERVGRIGHASMVARVGETGNRTLVRRQRQLFGIEQEERRLGPLLAQLGPGVLDATVEGPRVDRAALAEPGRRPRADGSRAAAADAGPDEPGSGPGDPLRRDVAGHARQGTRLAGSWLSLPDDDHDPAVRRPEHDQPAARGPRAGGRAGRSGRRSTDPAHGFLHPVDLAVAQREHAAFVELLASLGPDGPRARQRPRQSGSRLHVRPVAGHGPRRDPAATRQAQSASGAGAPSRPGRSPPASRRSAGSRRPAPSRAATRSGSGRTCCASGGRCGRTRTGAGQLAALVGGDVRVFDVPYWRGPAELIHLLSVISPIADDLAVVYLPLLPVGLWQLLRRSRDPAARGLGRGVRDARAATCSRSGPAWSSWPRATQGSRGRWPRPAARSTRTPRRRSVSTARAARPA